MAGSNSKKSRKPKTSKGEHGGGGKVKLTMMQKALMGKGVVHRLQPVKCQPYRGAVPKGTPDN